MKKNYNIQSNLYNIHFIKYYNDIDNTIHEEQNKIDLENTTHKLKIEYDKYNNELIYLNLIEEQIIELKNKIDKYKICINEFDLEYNYDIMYDSINNIKMNVFMGQLANYIYTESNSFKLLINILNTGILNYLQSMKIIHKIETLIYINNNFINSNSQHINLDISELNTLTNYINYVYDENDQQIFLTYINELTDQTNIIFNEILLIHYNEQSNISHTGGSIKPIITSEEVNIFLSIEKNILFNYNKLNSNIYNKLLNQKIYKNDNNINKLVLLKYDKFTEIEEIIHFQTNENDNIIQQNNIIQSGGTIIELDNIGYNHAFLDSYYNNVFDKLDNNIKTSLSAPLYVPLYDNLYDFYIYTTIYLITTIYDKYKHEEFIRNNDPLYIAKLIEEIIITQINIYIDQNILNIFIKEFNLNTEHMNIEFKLFDTKKISIPPVYSIYEDKSVVATDHAHIDKCYIYPNDLNNIIVNNKKYILKINLKIIDLLYNANINFSIATFNGKITINELIRNYNNTVINYILDKKYINNNIFNIYIKSFIKQELVDIINKLLINVNTINDFLNNIDINLYNNILKLIKDDDLYYNNILKYIKDSFHIVTCKIINKVMKTSNQFIIDQLEEKISNTISHKLNYNYIIKLWEFYFTKSITKYTTTNNIEIDNIITYINTKDHSLDDILNSNLNSNLNNIINFYNLLNETIKYDIDQKYLLNLYKNLNICDIQKYFDNSKHIKSDLLTYIFEIISSVCKLLIGNSIEQCMKETLNKYFEENTVNDDNNKNYVDIILYNQIYTNTINKTDIPTELNLSLIDILYKIICPKLVSITLQIFDSQSEYNGYIHESVNDILNNYFQLLNNYDNIIPAHIINLFTNNITSYFDIFTTKIITLWLVNIENILRYIINMHKCIKCYCIIHNINTE